MNQRQGETRKKLFAWSASVADRVTIKNRTIADNHPVLPFRSASTIFYGVAVRFSVIARLFPASCPSLSRQAEDHGPSALRRPLQDVARHAAQTAPAPDDRRRSRRCVLENALTLLIASGITRSRNAGDSRVESDNSTSGASRRNAQMVCTSWRSSISEAGSIPPAQGLRRGKEME